MVAPPGPLNPDSHLNLGHHMLLVLFIDDVQGGQPHENFGFAEDDQSIVEHGKVFGVHSKIEGMIYLMVMARKSANSFSKVG